MTQAELVKKWRARADELERAAREGFDRYGRLSTEQEEENRCMAQVYRECANELSAMTY